VAPERVGQMSMLDILEEMIPDETGAERGIEGIETETEEEIGQGHEIGREEAVAVIEDEIEAETKRSRSRDRKRSKRSRSRSRDRDARRRERREKREGGGDDFRVKEEPADTGYNDQYGNNYDYQGVNIKQEKVEDENGEGGDGHDDNGQDYDAGY